MSNPRVRKMADRIQVTVAEMLERRVKDPRLGFVTVTDVRVSGDTQHASVFYTVLGEEVQVTASAAALESAKGLIRSEVGKQLGTRHVPTLEFIHDALPETARHIEELLGKVRESDAAVAASAAGAVYAGEPDPYRKPHDDEDIGAADETDVDPTAVAPAAVAPAAVAPAAVDRSAVDRSAVAPAAVDRSASVE
ncbi:MAG: Ribosome-binding factor A [uncultured Nocardioidaceae bacterium]|uniref:Ribosome-binding factor A n=1 Tax=uncultured Nocardioidaceae bacterium TaxID=253824 RepID=A0A6J4M527_9ACTN|nr:MAG: Ribosome-binding factor A [uncultured Nocardioidaceae bacterium]